MSKLDSGYNQTGPYLQDKDKDMDEIKAEENEVTKNSSSSDWRI